jgi:hypothetical protein
LKALSQIDLRRGFFHADRLLAAQSRVRAGRFATLGDHPFDPRKFLRLQGRQGVQKFVGCPGFQQAFDGFVPADPRGATFDQGIQLGTHSPGIDDGAGFVGGEFPSKLVRQGENKVAAGVRQDLREICWDG